MLFRSVSQSRYDEVFKYSNNPVEERGIIPASDLIALGANNTTDAKSVLIEGSYVYEEKFKDEQLLKNLAEQIYFGIEKCLQ